ncbi:TPA: hypothetical protein JBA76_15820 [Legionella pneumophila subsp. pneumophila]|uniref:helix-turn-helix domain-containing protein n=1 Tax=Legionella pneumophila TaxID=446 RepID=UPI000770972E|nr:helix-turn-helix domain-containing protein [Legionella pneumophila]HAT8850756.1 hypothetical protein [Legionella pneumophila subsp. pneumophila]CZI81348.1 Uncharacterised protein [Legionella pneumophila]CZI83208.1 Uncharacterised protein [Legionella pneumophila]HAT9170703.1 hypothetical protein [Legionella pneumophila subsp. pneumophila]HDP0036723.1 helix-turn-helix domain-containing protein [Legionella pneumophila]
MISQIIIDRFLRSKKSREYDLHAHDKLVLFFLASYMGKKTSCYPSLKTLSHDCSLSVDSIKRAIKTLEKKEILSVKRVSGGNNQYAFNLKALEQPSADPTQCPQHLDAESPIHQERAAPSPSAKSTSNNNSNNIIKSTSIDTGKNNIPLPITVDVQEIFKYWQDVMKHPKAKLDNKRKQKIINALKLYSKEEIKEAIDGCANTPFYMGKNDRSQIYDDIGLILRDATNIERFINQSNIKKTERLIGYSRPEFLNGVI